MHKTKGSWLHIPDPEERNLQEGSPTAYKHREGQHHLTHATFCISQVLTHVPQPVNSKLRHLKLNLTSTCLTSTCIPW